MIITLPMTDKFVVGERWYSMDGGVTWINGTPPHVNMDGETARKLTVTSVEGGVVTLCADAEVSR